ncbi:MAG: peptide deformylase [Solirubrobacterales bacterium]|nr:peptide deformylase [Solirubrobacterales bacterium]MDX6662501.1 peptide deformylase [Solirubrobacterales bacterium]
MSVREVLRYPDPALKQICAPASAAELESVGEELVATMRSFERCVGIAAPQIGRLVRVVVVDVRGHPKAATDNGLLVLANPRLVTEEGSEVAREGCLSIPELTANVRRATRIVVEHAGGSFESEGFEARCVQHEIDHLDGILFLDRVESLVDDLFRRKDYAESPESPPPERP